MSIEDTNPADNGALEEGAQGVATPTEEIEIEGQQEQTPAAADNGGADLTKVMTERINKVREETDARVRAEVKAQYDAEVNKRWGHASFDVLTAEDDRIRNQQNADQFKAAGIDPSLINELVEQKISNDPVIKQAQQLAAQYQIEQAQRTANDQIRLISEIDPSIKTYEDLVNLPNYDDFRDLVLTKGYSFVDAYKLTNFDSLVSGKSAAARQAALNQMGSKGHLKGTGGGGGTVDEIAVPEETMKYYRGLFKGVSDEEFRKHYAASIKDQK